QLLLAEENVEADAEQLEVFLDQVLEDPLGGECAQRLADFFERPRGSAAGLEPRASDGVDVLALVVLAIEVDPADIRSQPGAAGEPQVPAARTGDLDVLDDLLRVLDLLDDRLRQLARIRLRRLGQHQRGVDGKIAVLRLPGRLALEIRRRRAGHGPGDGRRHDRAYPLLHHDFTVEKCASNSGRRRSQLACRCSIITLVWPSTGMKLVSPFQRGTTCQWRWSAMPAPATRPRFMPRLYPCAP